MSVVFFALVFLPIRELGDDEPCRSFFLQRELSIEGDFCKVINESEHNIYLEH